MSCALTQLFFLYKNYIPSEGFLWYNDPKAIIGEEIHCYKQSL